MMNIEIMNLSSLKIYAVLFHGSKFFSHSGSFDRSSPYVILFTAHTIAFTNFFRPESHPNQFTQNE